MGGNSTLHSTVLSDGVGTQEKFDLKSWQGLTELLKAGKNALKPEVYAEFRNLVLSYAQHGGDLEYKKRIDDIVATFGRSPVVSAEPIPLEETQEKTSLLTRAQNSRRIAPRFSDTLTPAQSFPVKNVAVTPEPIPAQEPAPVEVPVVESIIEVPVQQVPESAPATPERESEISIPTTSPSVVPPVATIPLSVSTEIPKSQEPELSHGEQAPFMTLEQYKVRIAEIKRAVNAHFGNPVALMAVPNNLGKVYMTALLSALKASTPGAPGSVGNAMVELERAYKTLIEGDMVSPNTVPKTPEPTPEPAPIVLDIKSETIPEPEPISVPERESVSVPEIPKAPESVPVPETISQQDAEERMSILERIESEQGIPPLEEHSEAARSVEMHSAFEKTDDTISAVVGSVHKTLNPLPHSISDLVSGDASGYENWATSIETKADDTSISNNVGTIAIRENKWTKKGVGEENDKVVLEQQGININEVVVKQTELFSPQISAALDTLLHDWSIFGGSGFFGMGPGGIEHPLYKKLSTLSIGEVVAGRFDGADPKVIKVIKQYVDAWRHEQGITFMLNETFEHYLRRVVQRIVKRQST